MSKRSLLFLAGAAALGGYVLLRPSLRRSLKEAGFSSAAVGLIGAQVKKDAEHAKDVAFDAAWHAARPMARVRRALLRRARSGIRRAGRVVSSAAAPLRFWSPKAA